MPPRDWPLVRLGSADLLMKQTLQNGRHTPDYLHL